MDLPHDLKMMLRCMGYLMNINNVIMMRPLQIITFVVLMQITIAIITSNNY